MIKIFFCGGEGAKFATKQYTELCIVGFLKEIDKRVRNGLRSHFWPNANSKMSYFNNTF